MNRTAFASHHGVSLAAPIRNAVKPTAPIGMGRIDSEYTDRRITVWSIDRYNGYTIESPMSVGESLEQALQCHGEKGIILSAPDVSLPTYDDPIWAGHDAVFIIKPGLTHDIVSATNNICWRACTTYKAYTPPSTQRSHGTSPAASTSYPVYTKPNTGAPQIDYIRLYNDARGIYKTSHRQFLDHVTAQRGWLNMVSGRAPVHAIASIIELMASEEPEPIPGHIGLNFVRLCTALDIDVRGMNTLVECIMRNMKDPRMEDIYTVIIHDLLTSPDQYDLITITQRLPPNSITPTIMHKMEQRIDINNYNTLINSLRKYSPDYDWGYLHPASVNG